MKVTIELDYDIMLALGAREALGKANGWWDSADMPSGTPEYLRQTLYQYAFADGMKYLMDLIKGK